MRTLVLCAIWLACYNHGLAQNLIVLDAETQLPIERAVVQSRKPQLFLMTNSSGSVEIAGFKKAERIEISCLGYQTVIKDFAALEKTQFVLSLSPVYGQVEELVISATRWKQSRSDVPGRISTIRSDEMKLLNPQTAADLLGISGEVFIQKSQQGGGSPMIRGFSANRLLYAVDGVRMNTAIFRSGNLHNVIALDPQSIEQTEVLFGPGSILYGSDAIGGVMSFQTLSAKLSDSGSATVKGKAFLRHATANQEFTGHADLSVGWKKWASVTSFTMARYGDMRMGRHGPEEFLKNNFVQRIGNADSIILNEDPRVQNPSGYNQINLMQKLRFSPNSKWDFEYGFHYSESSDIPRYDRLIETQSNGLPVFAVWNYGPQIWMMNNFSALHKGYNLLYDQMNIRLAHQEFQESRIDRRLNNQRLRTTEERVTAFSLNVDFEKTARKQHLYYGIELLHNDVQSEGRAIDIRNNNPIAVPDRYPASEWMSYAAYINYQYFVNNKLSLQAGARYNGFRINSDFTRHLSFFPFDFTTSRIQNGAVTGSLGAVFSPAKEWRISANLSTGFRAPNVDDIGKIFDFVQGEVVVPNTSLRAEYAYNGELNLSRFFGERLKLDFTVFYTYLDNAMVRRPFEVDGQDSIIFNESLSKVFAVQNAAYSTVFGFNAGIEAKLPIGFTVMGRYNFQRGREEMDNGELSASRHAAPAFGTAQLQYKYKKITCRFNTIFSAAVPFENLNFEERSKIALYAKDTDGNPYSPAWFTLNLAVMLEIHNNLSISGGVENILDKRYRPYSSGLAAAGRNFVISLTAIF